MHANLVVSVYELKVCLYILLSSNIIFYILKYISNTLSQGIFWKSFTIQGNEIFHLSIFFYYFWILTKPYMTIDTELDCGDVTWKLVFVTSICKKPTFRIYHRYQCYKTMHVFRFNCIHLFSLVDELCHHWPPLSKKKKTPWSPCTIINPILLTYLS